MPTLNDLITVESHTVKWAVDHMRNSLLTVDNSFQRNYVWLEKHQIKLIETILMGFPIPEIYLWQRETNASTGNTQMSIIDGQQRLGAILDFITDKFPLKHSELESYNQKSVFVGKKFSELEDGLKSEIWKFKISIRFVNESVPREDIVKMFLRLNGTNMTLNPQELRNAKFEGLFINLAVALSENRFWDLHSIFTLNDRRRMIDIQFISSILMFYRLGISEDTTQSNINQIYDLYNSEYKEKDEDERLFGQTLSEIEKMISGNTEVERFLKKKTHLYSLFVLVYYFIKKQGGVSEKQIVLYKKFVEAYNSDSKLNSNFTEIKDRLDIMEYKMLSSTGTQSRSNRMRRYEILKHLLD